MANAKKILIESETTETFRLRVTGPQTTRLFCSECDALEEMLELNAAADIAGLRAREILDRLATRQLHSSETATGHLLICRASLEDAMNADGTMRPAAMLAGENL